MRLASIALLAAFVAGPALAQETTLLWGDTHLHTSYSPDAYALENYTADPDVAYRFAKGLPVIHPKHRARVQIDTPLDFLVVSDHAEFMGVLSEIKKGNPAFMGNERGRRYKKMLEAGQGAAVFADLVRIANNDAKAVAAMNAPSVRRSVWAKVVDAAERHNDPGKFTAIIGWEWTSMPGGRNLHRVVFTPNGRDKAMQYLPFSLGHSQKPRDLWNWLAATATRTGSDFVAIPHNMNLSQGSMFPLADEDGRAVDADYARMRARWEPVVEATQYKGDSETHPLLSPTDEYADFETYEHLLAIGTGESKAKPDPGSYVRSALLRGLKLEGSLGANPYKFGLIGATDSHTGFSSAEESNFQGKYALDGFPENKTKTTTPGAIGWDASAQGLAGVWATANTRAAITAAFKRREVYATTGPRIQLRFFGGWGFKRRDIKYADFTSVGYRKGVPMGGDLTNAPKDHAPAFMIHAAKDPKDANLALIQVIKGWVDADGNTHEQVYDVTWPGKRKKDDEKPAPLGNTVDIATGTYDNSIGAPALAAVWADPDFDPAQRAFYYARVLQIPTPRHSLYDTLALGQPPEASKHAIIIQERAYSSPIWYTP